MAVLIDPNYRGKLVAAMVEARRDMLENPMLVREGAVADH